MGLAYHTELYLFVFLPLVVLVYHFSSQKMRRAVLILAGYLFFWSFSRWMVLYLIAVSGLIYGAGRWMEHLKETGRARAKEFPSKERSAIKKQYKAKEKRVLMAGIIILLGILAYLKYCNFFIQNMNRIAMAAGKDFYLEPQKLLIPIGISFYTLEAIGYMADVYWGRIKAEHNCKNSIVSWIFSADHGGTDQQLEGYSRCSLGMQTGSEPESCKGNCPYCMGNVQKDRGCRQTFCCGDSDF